VKVSVFDKTANESNEVVFPFSFEITPKEYAYQLPPPFDQGDLPRLGYIAVDLFYPGIGGYGGSGDALIRLVDVGLPGQPASMARDAGHFCFLLLFSPRSGKKNYYL